MNTWIALLRGINVGGHNVLAMAELRASLETLQLRNPRTHIQSGNIVFESTARSPRVLAKKIRQHLAEDHNVTTEVLVLSNKDLMAAIEDNPYPKATKSPGTLHFFFLSESAVDADLEGITALKSKTENFLLAGQVFYLWAPDGIGRSKLAGNVEKLLGVPTTARNFRTVAKLAEMTEL